MSLCIAPSCNTKAINTSDRYCQTCGTPLLLQDRYSPIRAIGEGGFGRTFLAIDTGLPHQPKCVIKQLSEQSTPEGRHQAQRLFHGEAMRLKQVGNHPQIPMLLDYFEERGYQYVVQEYIDGWTLASEVETEGCFTESKVWQVLIEISLILRFIHGQNIIHRDIKPCNIMRQRQGNRLVLIDFGVAKLLGIHSDLKKVGTLVGSPEYMAPEQAQGEIVHSSDLYSLGVTCLYLLCGRSPLELYSPANDFWYWRDALPSEQQVSDRLGAVLDRLLQTPIERRFPSAKVLSFHLMACQSEHNRNNP